MTKQEILDELSEIVKKHYCTERRSSWYENYVSVISKNEFIDTLEDMSNYDLLTMHLDIFDIIKYIFESEED